jgi:hypothetical protein
MNTRNFISAIAFIASLGLMTSTVYAKPPVSVDCDRGESLNKAVNQQTGNSGPIFISVSGTCEEDVFIRRDDVTIIGKDSATISGTVIIENGNRILFQDLTITGPNDGLRIGASYVRLVNSSVSENEYSGLIVFRNSTVELLNTTVAENGEFGAFVQRSAFEVNNSQMLDNGDDGLALDISSEALVRSTKISGNQRWGFSAGLHSVIELSDATEVSGNSLSGAVIGQDSALRIITSDVIFDDMIRCDDTESSFANVSGVPIGGTNCTDFNQ